MIDGEGVAQGFVGTVAPGEDGPASTPSLDIGGSIPFLRLSYGEASVSVTFGADGNPIVNMRDAEGKDYRITTE